MDLLKTDTYIASIKILIEDPDKMIRSRKKGDQANSPAITTSACSQSP